MNNPFYPEFKICSQAEAEERVREKPHYWNVVSIFSGGGGKHGGVLPDYQNKYKSICSNRFHDIDTPEDGLIMCNETHIKNIIEFSENVVGQPLVVNCFAGVSRSSAISFLVLLNQCSKQKYDYPVDRALDYLVSIKNIHTIYPNRAILNMGIDYLCKENTEKLIQWRRNLYQNEIFRQIYG